MPAPAKPSTTTLSTKGQIILPKPVRALRGWHAGTRLVVRDTPEGVLLTAAPVFDASVPGEVFARLKRSGAVRSLDEMDAAVLREARRHARD